MRERGNLRIISNLGAVHDVKTQFLIDRARRREIPACAGMTHTPVQSFPDVAPLVSIIISCYNHEKYIEECILSIVNQTYKNIELIVIDDGSRDSSPAILRKLREKYGFFLKIRENRGLSKTLNEAIRNHAHGKYLAGCGSDDFLLPDRIERQVGFLENNPGCDMVFGKVYIVDKESRIIDKPVIFKPFPDTVTYITFDRLLDGNCIPAMSAMLKRETWDKCGGYNENILIEDYDMWLKVAFYGKIAWMNEFFSCYRWHGENLSTHVLKIYTDTRELVQSWKDRMDPAVARKVLPRRDSLTFCVLARKYKKEALSYFRPVHSYWDSYILGNYIKGLWKLAFCWNYHHTVWK